MVPSSPEAPAPSDTTFTSVTPLPELSTVTLEDIDGIQYLRYPLPTKSGAAGQDQHRIHTHRSPQPHKDKPYHWYLMHHMVCSIADGHWFACAWVDEKESELAMVSGPVQVAHIVHLNACHRFVCLRQCANPRWMLCQWLLHHTVIQ